MLLTNLPTDPSNPNLNLYSGTQLFGSEQQFQVVGPHSPDSQSLFNNNQQSNNFANQHDLGFLPSAISPHFRYDMNKT